MWKNVGGRTEPTDQVKHIFVVGIKDFIDTYKLDTKQKKKLIANHLNEWLKKRIPPPDFCF